MKVTFSRSVTSIWTGCRKAAITPLVFLLLGVVSCASAKITLKEGDTAPDFSLTGNDGEMHKLSDFKGQYVVLYFYPKDETPGCTTEACSFRDNISDITKTGTKVIGVSVQDVASHKDFEKKYGLNFLLLADTDKKVSKDYGVLNETWGMDNRVTFIIDPSGKIAKIYPKVDPDGHAKEVLSELETLQNKN
ncbi:MAG TPA: peroxiredoxin [Candidatus Acidoferrales bacterium]|nr:peroxiredoxin [Candidatus Acidoferrales bacterium]